MPDRYFRLFDLEDIIVAYKIHRVAHDLAIPDADYTIAPLTDQPVITRHPLTGERELSLMRWSMIPGEPSTAHTARTEDLLETSLWKTSFLERRCLVPASGYWEWQTNATKRKLFRIEPAYDERQVFAGIWQESLDPTSGLLERSFAIVTTTANELVVPVAPRMPVTLHGPQLDRWLTIDPNQPPPLDLLVPDLPEYMNVSEAFPAGGVLRDGYPEPEDFD